MSKRKLPVYRTLFHNGRWWVYRYDKWGEIERSIVRSAVNTRDRIATLEEIVIAEAHNALISGVSQPLGWQQFATLPPSLLPPVQRRKKRAGKKKGEGQ